MKKILYASYLIILALTSCDNRKLAEPIITYKVELNQASSGGLLNSQYSTDIQVVTDSSVKNSDTYTLTATITKGTVKNLDINSTPYQAGMAIQKLNQVTFTPTSSGAVQIIFDVTNNHGVSHYDTLNITVQEFSVQFSVSDSGVADTAYKSIATKFNFIISVNQAQAGSDTAKFTFAASFLQGSGTLKVNNVAYAIGQPIAQGSSTITLTPSATGTIQLLLKAYNSAGVFETDTVSVPVAAYVNVPYIVSAAIGTMYWPGTTTTTTVIDATDTIPVSITLTSNSPNMTYQITAVSGDGILKTTSLQSISYPTSISQGISNYKLLLSNEPLGSHTYTFTITDANGVSHNASISYTVTNVSFTLTATKSSRNWPGTSIAKNVVRTNDTIPFSINLSSSDPSMTYSITAFSGDGQLKDGSLNNINLPISIPQGTNNYNLQIYGEPTGSHTATLTITDINGYSHTASITYTVSANVAPTLNSGSLIHEVGNFLNFAPYASPDNLSVTVYCASSQQFWKNFAAYVALLNLNYNGSDADGYIASYKVTGTGANGAFSFTLPIGTPITNSAPSIGGNNGNPPSTCGNCYHYLDFYTVNGNWTDVQFCQSGLTISSTIAPTLTLYDNEGAASGSITIPASNISAFTTFAANPSNF